MKTNENANANSVKLTNEQINSVIKSINAESVTLGAVIRNFVTICNKDSTARYMLDIITKQPNSHITLTINQIRQAVCKQYPYIKNGQMLEKKDYMFVPVQKYSGIIIKRAFYNAVGQTNTESFNEFVNATPSEIEEMQTKAEEKKQKAIERRAEKKAESELFREFFERVITCEDAKQAWGVIKEYKK
jgi:hypothetical protein